MVQTIIVYNVTFPGRKMQKGGDRKEVFEVKREDVMEGGGGGREGDTDAEEAAPALPWL